MKKVNEIDQLEECQFRFVIRRLAEFEQPKIIQAEVEYVYDIEVPVSLIKSLNPLKEENNISPGWIDYFTTIRKQVLRKAVQVPHLFKLSRLDRLARMMKVAEANQDVEQILNLHERINAETDPVYKDLVRLMKVTEGELTIEEYMS